jgi:hypothetical protein
MYLCTYAPTADLQGIPFLKQLDTSAPMPLCTYAPMPLCTYAPYAPTADLQGIAFLQQLEESLATLDLPGSAAACRHMHRHAHMGTCIGTHA